MKPFKFKYNFGNKLITDSVIVQGDPLGLSILLSLIDRKSVLSPSVSSADSIANYCKNLNLRSIVIKVGGDDGVSKEKLLSLMTLFEV